MGNLPYRHQSTASTASCADINESSPLLDDVSERDTSLEQDSCTPLQDEVITHAIPLQPLSSGHHGSPEYDRLSPWWKAGVSEGSESGLQPRAVEAIRAAGDAVPLIRGRSSLTQFPAPSTQHSGWNGKDNPILHPVIVEDVVVKVEKDHTTNEKGRWQRGTGRKMTLSRLRNLFPRSFRPPRPALVRYPSDLSTSSDESSVLEKGRGSQHPRRDRRKRRSICCYACAMIGTIIALVLTFYAWNVEMLWNDLTRPSPLHLPVDAVSNQTALLKRRSLHSHNDEMHGKDALTLAMSLGFGSIEVDTWLSVIPKSSAVSNRAIKTFNEREGASSTGMSKTLLTGHKVKDVTDKTLAGSYLDPLFRRLEENNSSRRGNQSVVGLYKDDPGAEVQLVIDMKSDGEETWSYLTAALQPFLDKGYLSSYDPSTSSWNRSALLIIGTGNTPIAQLYHQSPRYIFYDAPLLALSKPVTIPSSPSGPGATFEWDKTISPMASSKFPVIYHLALGMPPRNPVVDSLRGYSAVARNRGITSRWWGGAKGPTWARRRVWDLQKAGESDWVNADDLVDAASWLKVYEARGEPRE